MVLDEGLQLRHLPLQLGDAEILGIVRVDLAITIFSPRKSSSLLPGRERLPSAGAVSVDSGSNAPCPAFVMKLNVSHS